ncbi:MAG: domain S-box protein [Ramlibacter sp.]|nr:domain S-box protein [Ramlibacter sp.]
MNTPSSSDITAANFRAFADHAAVMMWMTDATGHCIALNNKWYAFTGQAAGEGEGIGWTNAVHEADRVAAKTTFLKASADKTPFHAEYRLRRHDGAHRWVIDFAEPRFSEDGVYGGYIGSVIDITERKEAEQALRAAHERLQRAQVAAKLGTFEWDMRDNRLEWSDGIFPLLGLQPFSREPSMDLVMQCVPERDREGLSQLMAGITSTVGEFDIEFRVIGFDGKERWIASIAEVEAGPDGKPAVMRGVDIDVTERRRTRQALAESNAHLTAAFEQTAAGMCEVDMTGRILRVNQRYCEMVGRPATELLQMRMQEITHAADLPANLALFEKVIETGEAFQIEKRYVRPDGAVLWVNNTVSRIVLPGETSAEQRTTVLAVVVDITARKAAEDALRQADKRKDEFLAMLAHELRNPLAPISSAASILKLARGDEARTFQACEIISRQVKHMTRLVDDLLDVSRVTRGLVRLERKPVDIKRMVVDALEQARPLIEQRQHRLSVQTSPLPAFVEGDHNRLVQVVGNLLNNSAKFTPERGRITLATDVADGCVKIMVEDDGVGMAREMVDSAFHLFSQAERTLDRSQGGLGIGLALVKSLVDMHGGRVSARSEGPGRGSRFDISLPLIAPPRDDPGSPGQMQKAEGRRLRILVVDDNVDAAQTLAMLLETMGHEVHVLHDPRTALQRAEEVRPDVCLLDIGLPHIDGISLARMFRRSSALGASRLVAVSGYGQEVDRERALAAGFDRFFVKPLDEKSLNGALNG